MSRASVALALVVSLIAPTRVAFAQDPAAAPSGDRDLDGVADAVDSCPDTYGAPPQGCPPQAPPVVADRDGDGIADEFDQCIDVAATTTTGCPDTSAPPVTTTPEVPAGDPNDEYQVLLRTLPNDYDLNYTFDSQGRKRNRENDPGRAAKRIRALGISGSSLLLLGTVGMIATLSAGLGMANKAKKTLEGQKDDQDFDPAAPFDADERKDALRKGEVGDKTAIIGASASGGLMALGTVLLIAARSLRKKQYGTADTGGGSRGSMSDKTKRNLTIYGALLLVYGLIGVGAGAVLAKNNDDKKARNGRILLGVGGGMMGLGALLFIPLAINKFKKTARVNAGGMWVRGGGGASLRVNF